MPKSGEPLRIGSSELFAVLAICKRLEDAAQREVIASLSTHALADIVVVDYASRHPHRFSNDLEIERRLTGFLARDYTRFEGIEATDLMEARERRRAQG